MSAPRQSHDRLETLVADRILVLDGAMGTMLQRHALTEEDYRGRRFASHDVDLQGNHDLLVLTQPQFVAAIHRQYLDAGVDIITTNTFNANRRSQASYHLEALTYETNVDAARLARGVADEVTAAWPSKPRFVAGAIGPTPARTLTADDARIAYADQVRGLIDGGADILLLETVTSTGSAVAAMEVIRDVQNELGSRLPLMVSCTIGEDARTLSGDSMETFYHAILPLHPWSIGINCAGGRAPVEKALSELASVAECWVSVHPSAGLPNAAGEYDAPNALETLAVAWANARLINIVGGCCGTTPDQIRAVAEAMKIAIPRVPVSTTSREPSAMLTVEEARANRFRTDWDTQEVAVPWFVGIRVISDQRLEEILPFIDWSQAQSSGWDRGRTKEILTAIVRDRRLQARAVHGFWPANTDADDILIYKDDARRTELMRLQMPRRVGSSFSLADFIAPVNSLAPDYIGLFALTTGIGLDALVREYLSKDDEVGARLATGIAAVLAEALSEFLHKQMRIDWGYGEYEAFAVPEILAGKYRGVRAEFGGSSCPEIAYRKPVFELLGASNLGMVLADDFTMTPPATISGMYFSHPGARLFGE